MQIGEYVLMIDTAAKFYNSMRVAGWFHHPEDTLAAVELIADERVASVGAVGLEHAGVATLGPRKGFAVQILRRTMSVDQQARLRFTTARGWQGEASVAQLCQERIAYYPSPGISQRFIAAMDALPQARVLDVGGRARSGLARKDLFKVRDYVVFDVLAGDNVDVVGDAHELSRYFPAESFDGVFSVAVFEHLMMPWTVATEINRVLKVGGLMLIATHQTVGMHDQPWDFWRYSDSAWDALFNARTGFEVVESALDFEQFIIPLVLRPGKEDAELAVGYEGSTVLVRKVGPCTMSWPLRPADIVTTRYPG